MMEVIIFIGVIVLVGLVFNLRSRVDKLEKLMAKGGVSEGVPYQSRVGEQVQSRQMQTEPAAISSQITDSPQTVEPGWWDNFREWLKDDWLLKLGAFLLLIGFAWFTTYAFLHNWIGPMGRIALGLMAGALFIVAGWWRIRKYLHQGGIFLVLGSTTILLTTFAAREVYDFFTPLSALIIMFLSTTFVAFASVKYKSRSLALLSLILAGVAPLMIDAPVTNYIGLFTYLLIVILGVIWIVAVTEMRSLTLAALIMVFFYSIPHFFSMVASADRDALLIFAYVFSAIFFLTNVLGILKTGTKRNVISLITAGGTGVFLLIWIMSVAPEEWQSLIISAWMLVFGAGAFLVFRATRKKAPFYVYAGVGIVFLAAATGIELDGASLTIAYTIESAVIIAATYLAFKDVRLTEKLYLLLLGPALLSLGSMAADSWSTSVFNEDFFVLFILGVLFFGLGHFFGKVVGDVNDRESQKLNQFLMVMGSVYAYVLLWLSLHAFFLNQDTAVMLSLFVYTIVGVTTYFYGLINANNFLRIYGGVLLGLVVARLLIVDIWKMDLTERIITFFLIGALLVSTAFLGKRKQRKNLIQ